MRRSGSEAVFHSHIREELTWSNFVRLSPAAFRIEARSMMARPIMKATTGLAWWAGTESLGGNSGEGVADSKTEVAVSMTEVTEASMHNCEPSSSKQMGGGGKGKRI